MAWIRHELNALGIPPLKRFGQHFLVDTEVRGELIGIAMLTTNDTVIEVGPGLGFLTSVLAQKAGRVVAVEKDRTLAGYLKDKFSKQHNVTIAQGDILTVQLPDGAKIVSSPPYNISSELILRILDSRFKLAALLMQQEFVGRLTAASGSRDYGRLTVMLQYRANAEFVRKVPRSAFYPKPKVDSALITITPTSDQAVRNLTVFEDLVRSLFTQRRRKLRAVLRRYLKQRYPNNFNRILEHASIPDRRVYETSPQEFLALSDEIVDVALRQKEAS